MASGDLWTNVGIEQEQGGYPPLILGIKYGHVYIMARSDPRLFKEKGGCSLSEEKFFGETKVCETAELNFKILWRCKIMRSHILLSYQTHLEEAISWKIGV